MRTLPIRWACLLLALAAPGTALADPLVATKTATVISDPMGNLISRSLPGSVVDYKLNVSNPLGNLLKPVKTLVISEAIPATVDLQVTDLGGANSGPVEFLDGSLLGTGLLTSGLTYVYNPAIVDSIEFSTDGLSWTSTTTATSGNYNPSIRAIRVTLSGTFATSTAFQLRYRVRIK